MNGKRKKRMRKEARKELRKQGLTPYDISVRARQAAMLELQGCVRDKPRFAPEWLWKRVVGFVLPDVAPIQRAAVDANLEVLCEVA